MQEGAKRYVTPSLLSIGDMKFGSIAAEEIDKQVFLDNRVKHQVNEKAAIDRPISSGEKASAALFFARDFLADELPLIAPLVPDITSVYIATTKKEAKAIRTHDATATIFVLQDFIYKAQGSTHRLTAQQSERLSRDRYLPKLENDEKAAVVAGLEMLLSQIGERFLVRIYVDEPVSGYLNDRLTDWVRGQGGLPCHFHTAWLPNHIFFTADRAQKEPIPLNLIEGAEVSVKAHIDNRKIGGSLPLYLHDYSKRLQSLSSAGKFWLKGVYRLLYRDSFYMNRDPWPHFFQARCIVDAQKIAYADLSMLKAEGRRVVLVPLHYEPEAVLGYLWDEGDQLNLATRLLEILPEDRVLVLKEHPSQPGALAQKKWANLLARKNVHAMAGTAPLEELLACKATLFSIGSTAVLEAVRLQAPVYVVGKPHFADAPGVTNFPDFMTGSLPPAVDPVDEKSLLLWYAGFLEEYCVEGRFLRGNTRVPRAQEVFQALLRQSDEV